MLYKTAFPISLLQYLFYTSEVALYPVVWTVNQLTSPFLISTKEDHWDWEIIIKKIVYPPLIILFLSVFGIPAIFGVILRCLLHLFRRPYVLSVEKSFHPPSINERRASISVGRLHPDGRRNSLLSKGLSKTFTVSSANLCLLPELLSRINNLPNTDHRSWKIGERIVIDQFFFQNSMNSIRSFSPVSRKNSSTSQSERTVVEPGHNILTHFPKLDFLCLQETWDRDYSHKLMSELHKVFPWIMYDVGKTNLLTNRFMLNSGLMLASKYEILDADFHPYTESFSQCLYSSKGLLMTKVLLSSTEHHDEVGYIFTTHLQAYQGMEDIIQKQLDEILSWTKKFREESVKSEDIVVFDVLCGDFNFDNISPIDEPCTRHKLFDVYEDVCRISPGQDQDWTVGTEMRQMCLWEKQISTPEGLKEALEDPILRHRYVVDGNIKDGTMREICKTKPLEDEDVKTKLMGVSGKRRIDYILYRKDTPLAVQNFSFVTRLATLTDHIPVTMTFSSQQ